MQLHFHLHDRLNGAIEGARWAVFLQLLLVLSDLVQLGIQLPHTFIVHLIGVRGLVTEAPFELLFQLLDLPLKVVDLFREVLHALFDGVLAFL